MKSSKISVLIPTRKRPSRLEKSILSLVDLSASPRNLEFIIGIDDDDTETQNYVVDSLFPNLDQKNIAITALTFSRMGYHRLHEYLNAMYQHSTGNWLILFNDDAVMITSKWDDEIRKYDGEFKCLAFDTHRHHPYSIFPIIPREWVEYMGAISNHHMFDAVISQIAYMLGIMQRTNIQVEHERFDLIGEEADQTYRERTMFEGNPQDPRDINHIDNRSWRTNAAEKISQALMSRGIDMDFWQGVKEGRQDLWAEMRKNDPNNQTKTIPVKKLSKEKQ
jgi:glycosyltransferase involved in cell wall biosynthesis